MIKGSYEVEVIVHGSPAREYYKDGKTYVEGREGTSFSVRMRNNSSERALFVPTVDGLSILNGEEGAFDSRGYVIPAWGSSTIGGWRTSDREVAEFYFSTPKESYRRKMGRGDNMGSVGVAVFKEKRHVEQIVVPIEKFKPWIKPPYKTPWMFEKLDCQWTNNVGGQSSTAIHACSVSNSSIPQDIGTGWGQTKKSEVTTVSFDRESSSEEVFTIYYNTKDRLEEAGVTKDRPLYITSEAFPGNYCKPPKR